MKKIIYYLITHRIGATGGMIKFRLEGESRDIVINLSQPDILVVAALLALKNPGYDNLTQTFGALDNDPHYRNEEVT